MIRLIQRKLIIPRGDTGSFSVPAVKIVDNSIAVFSIIDTSTKTIVFSKEVPISGETITIEFAHEETVNLPTGAYVWDIKFYQNPQYMDEELVSGDEVDSYYAGFNLPSCEIRETGDRLLLSSDSPSTTLTPAQLNVLNAAVASTTQRAQETAENAQTATGSAQTAAASASAAQSSATEAATYAENAASLAGDADESSKKAQAAQVSAEAAASAAASSAERSSTSATNASNYASQAHDSATSAHQSAQSATGSASHAEAYMQQSLENLETATQCAEWAAEDADRAEAAAASIHDMTAVAETLPEGRAASASYDSTSGALTLGIPKGDTGATGPKGDPGDDYVLTAADKAEIAGMVNVPVTDVQVNGSSIVSDGVANVSVPTKTSDLTNDSNFISDTNYNHTDNNYTTLEKEKLSGIESGAKANVNADWNAVSGDAQILNKPTNVSSFTNDAGYLTEHQDISGKADATDTVLNTTLSLGRQEESTIGANSVALGRDVIASGNNSFAGGQSTIASGNVSRAEGYGAEASGSNSHAEGNGTIANGSNVHAEGKYNVAQTIISNWVANTHYNVGDKVFHIFTTFSCIEENTDSIWVDAHWKIYNFTSEVALVVGNGSTSSSRSNAYMLDWDGNGHYGGNVYVNCNSDSSGGEKLATMSEVVTDVQVNGTSIVENGVANVPRATSSVDGVTRYASTSEVKGGAGTARSIMPALQHAAAFYGLAKAAGDTTQSASSNAVGTYTDEARKAIKKMLGIYDEWELIADVTTEEDLDNVVISTDISGQPFELKEMRVRALLPDTTTGTRDYIRTSVKYNTTGGVQTDGGSPACRYSAATGAMYFDLHVTITADFYTADVRYGTSANNSASLLGASEPHISSTIAVASLCGVGLQQYNASSTLIPAGTIIKLYGIRK